MFPESVSADINYITFHNNANQCYTQNFNSYTTDNTLNMN
jgi:hypothetical protein